MVLGLNVLAKTWKPPYVNVPEIPIWNPRPRFVNKPLVTSTVRSPSFLPFWRQREPAFPKLSEPARRGVGRFGHCEQATSHQRPETEWKGPHTGHARARSRLLDAPTCCLPLRSPRNPASSRNDCATCEVGQTGRITSLAPATRSRSSPDDWDECIHRSRSVPDLARAEGLCRGPIEAPGGRVQSRTRGPCNEHRAPVGDDGRGSRRTPCDDR